MKLFCQKDGINTMYIQKKDLKYYQQYQSDLDTQIRNVQEDEFISLVDIDAIDFFSKEKQILDYQENISLSLSELQEKANQLMQGQEDLPTFFLYNQLEDISALCSFKLGKIALPLPLIEDMNGPYFSNGTYKIRTLVDPFKVSIRKVTGKDFEKEEVIPQKIVEQATIYTKRKLGYSGDLAYCYETIPSKDLGQTILDIRFKDHEKLISQVEPVIKPQTEVVLPKSTIKQKIKNILQHKVMKKN